MSGPKRPRPKCPWPKCPTFEGIGARSPFVTSMKLDMRSNIDVHLLAIMHMQEACREQHEMCMFLCHQVSVQPFNSM